MWSPQAGAGEYFHGTIAFLGALFHAGRHDELLALVDKARPPMWHYRLWGVEPGIS